MNKNKFKHQSNIHVHQQPKKPLKELLLESTEKFNKKVRKQIGSAESFINTSLPRSCCLFETRDINLFSTVSLDRSATSRETPLQKSETFSICDIDNIVEYDEIVRRYNTLNLDTHLCKYVCLGNTLLSAALTQAIPENQFSDITSMIFGLLFSVQPEETPPDELTMLDYTTSIKKGLGLCNILPCTDKLKETLGTLVSVEAIDVRIPTYGCLFGGGGMSVSFTSLEDFVHWCYTVNTNVLKYNCNRQVLSSLAANNMKDDNVTVDLDATLANASRAAVLQEIENNKVTTKRSYDTTNIDLPLIARNRLFRSNQEWVVTFRLKLDVEVFFKSIKSVKALIEKINESEIFDSVIDKAMELYEDSQREVGGRTLTRNKFIQAFATDLWQVFNRKVYENNIVMMSTLCMSIEDKFNIGEVDNLFLTDIQKEDLLENFALPCIQQWFLEYANLYEGTLFKEGDIDDMLESKEKFSRGWIMQYINMRNHTATLNKFDAVKSAICDRVSDHNMLFTPEESRQEVTLLDANYIDGLTDDLVSGQPAYTVGMRM